MKILAFDTSSSTCSVALMIDKEIKALHQIAPMKQARLILPMIDEVLTLSHIRLDQLDAIAYSCGPGSFTGVRIANSVAQGIGFAKRLPIIRVSSLAVLAQSAYLEKNWTTLGVAVDARMGQIYWAVYQVNSQGIVELRGKEALCSLEEIHISHISEFINGCGIGDGWEKYGNMLIKQLNVKPHAIHPMQLPKGEAILQLAKSQFERGAWISPSQAVPEYFR